MIKAVIFDLDGTLVNSLNDLAISTNYALTQHGFKPHPVDAYKYFVGDGMAKLIERTIPSESLNEEVFQSVFECFMAYYRQNFLANTVAYDGINDLLAELLDMGLKLAVVSNKADSMAKKVVTEIFGDDIFSIVIGKCDGYPTKPNPTSTLETIEKIGVKPEECVFVGDSGMDMLTAVNAGCYPLGVLWGFRTADELSKKGAKALAKSPNEIISIIKEI